MGPTHNNQDSLGVGQNWGEGSVKITTLVDVSDDFRWLSSKMFNVSLGNNARLRSTHGLLSYVLKVQGTDSVWSQIS